MMNNKTYVIVQFNDESVEIIRNEWAFYDDEKIISSCFPTNVSKKELEIFLKSENLDCDSIFQGEGNPFAVSKIFEYTGKDYNFLRKKFDALYIMIGKKKKMFRICLYYFYLH